MPIQRLFRGRKGPPPAQLTNEEAREVFEQFDRDGSGLMESSELVEALFALGCELSEADLDKIYKQADEDNSGELSIEEFRNAYGMAQLLLKNASVDTSKLNPAALKEIFERFDHNRNGRLERKELAAAFASMDYELDTKDFDRIYNECAKDNGYLTLKEFNVAYGMVKTDAIHRPPPKGQPNKEQLKEVFDRYDKDRSGRIEGTELEEALRSYGFRLTNRDLEIIFREADKDGNGDLELKEFMMAYSMADTLSASKRWKNGTPSNDQLKEVFKRFDRDQGNSLDRREISAAIRSVGCDITDKDLDRIFKEADKDGGGDLSFKEFGMAYSMAKQIKSGKSTQAKLSDAELREVFERFDRDHGGRIDRRELAAALTAMGFDLSERELKKVFDEADKDGGGDLNMKEFKKAFEVAQSFASSERRKTDAGKTSNARASMSSNELREAFERFDRDRSGRIERKELEKALRSMGLNLSDRDMKTVFEEADKDGGGDLNLKEFGKAYALAQKLSANSQPNLKEAFERYDRDRSGRIERKELDKALKGMGFNLSDRDMKKIFEQTDKDGSSNLDFKEFSKAYALAQELSGSQSRKSVAALSFSELKEVFARFDVDRGGTLDRKEFEKALRSAGCNLTDRDFKKIFEQADKDGGGDLSFKEFTKAYELAQKLGSNELRDVFERFDKDRSGRMDKRELDKALRDMGFNLSERDLKRVFEEADKDGGRDLDLKEFNKAVALAKNLSPGNRERRVTVSNHELREVFERFDQDRSGRLERKELEKALRAMGCKLADRDLKQVFAQADKDGGGDLTLKEFGKAYQLAQALSGSRKSNAQFGSTPVPVVDPAELKEIFERFDRDGNGQMDRRELVAALKLTGMRPTDRDIDEIMRESDKDNTGELNFREFSTAYTMAMRLANKRGSIDQRRQLVPGGGASNPNNIPAGINQAELREVFELFDADKSGNISRKELADALRSLGCNPTQRDLERIFAESDKDGGGDLSLKEFGTAYAMALRLSTKGGENEEELLQMMFQVLDSDNSGSLSLNELKRRLTREGDRMKVSEVEEVFKIADRSGDGQIDFKEFEKLMKL